MRYFRLFLPFGVCFLAACVHRPAPTLVLNEICGKDFPNNEWVEIYNCSDKPVSLKGIYLLKIDEDGIDKEIFRFSDGELAPHSVYVISSLQRELQSRISSKKELGIELVDARDHTLDSFYRDDEVGEHAHPAGGSYARVPDGSGQWTITAHSTPGERNQ